MDSTARNSSNRTYEIDILPDTRDQPSVTIRVSANSHPEAERIAKQMIKGTVMRSVIID